MIDSRCVRVALAVLNGVFERQPDAVQRDARHLDALVVAPLERDAVDFPDARARELVEHAHVLRQVQLRQARRQAGANVRRQLTVRQGCELIRLRLRLRPLRVAARPRTRRGRFLALDERNRPSSPAGVGRAEHVGVGYPGHAQQLLLDLGRVHVLRRHDTNMSLVCAPSRTACRRTAPPCPPSGRSRPPCTPARAFR